jgi:sulfide:quinone oxidoreductase
MPATPLTAGLSVSSQIQPADLAKLARAGFRSIINNRPDSEAPDQPDSPTMEAAARDAGLRYLHIPVTPGELGEDQVEEFGRALRRLPGPVLAYCRTGTRSTQLWALSQVGSLDADTIVATAAKAGYDLAPLRPRLHRPSA